MRQILDELGFEKTFIIRKDQSDLIIKSWNIGRGAENVVFSAYIGAKKKEVADESL